MPHPFVTIQAWMDSLWNLLLPHKRVPQHRDLQMDSNQSSHLLNDPEKPPAAPVGDDAISYSSS